jgi:hypothetical protein
VGIRIIKISRKKKPTHTQTPWKPQSPKKLKKPLKHSFWTSWKQTHTHTESPCCKRLLRDIQGKKKWILGLHSKQSGRKKCSAWTVRFSSSLCLMTWAYEDSIKYVHYPQPWISLTAATIGSKRWQCSRSAEAQESHYVWAFFERELWLLISKRETPNAQCRQAI